MKKWIIGILIVLLLGVFSLGMVHFSGAESLLLDCLPPGEWQDFEGGCGNPTNPGRGLNLDDYRERCSVPEDVLDTTPENLRFVLQGITVRGGKFLNLKGDYFQYDFLTEDGERCRFRVYKNGCIALETRGSPSAAAYYHDGGRAYRTLDQYFASIHELRQWMPAPAWG